MSAAQVSACYEHATLWYNVIVFSSESDSAGNNWTQACSIKLRVQRFKWKIYTLWHSGLDAKLCIGSTLYCRWQTSALKMTHTVATLYFQITGKTKKRLLKNPVLQWPLAVTNTATNHRNELGNMHLTIRISKRILKAVLSSFLNSAKWLIRWWNWVFTILKKTKPQGHFCLNSRYSLLGDSSFSHYL